jgi:hypothetical protein
MSDTGDTLLEQWISYRNGPLRDLSPSCITDSRNCFYCGALAVFAVLGETATNEKQILAGLARMSLELDGFTAEFPRV